LYSKEYKEILQSIHAKEEWGGGAANKIKYFKEFYENNNCKDLLDYGCGNGSLYKKIKEENLGWKVYEYDPGIPEKSGKPKPADFVTCIDVLEHVEPEHLDNVLKHIRSLTKVGAWFCVCKVPAYLILPDGRNAHLIVEDEIWWKDKLNQYFNFENLAYNTSAHYAGLYTPK
jgi:hypothetical protein